MAQQLASRTDPLQDPVNLLRWYLRYDTSLRQSLSAELASLDPKRGRDANRAQLARWMADEGLVDGVTQAPLFTIEQLAAAVKPQAGDPIALTPQELNDARELVFNTLITQPYRARLAKLAADLAGLDPGGCKSEDAYYNEVAARFESFIEATRRPALTDNLGRAVPASTARLSTIARSLTAENAPVENWWGTYNFVVATYQNATRQVTAPAAPIAQPASPSQIYLAASSSAVTFGVEVYGVDDQGKPRREMVTVPGSTAGTLRQVLGLYVVGDTSGAVPDGVQLTVADAGGATLVTLTLSAANEDSRYAGRGGMEWVVVDGSLSLTAASAGGDAVLVGKRLDGGALVDEIEHISFTAGGSVSAQRPWAQVDAVYLGAYAGTLQLSAPHSRAGQTRMLDPRQDPVVSNAPQLWIGSPRYSMVLAQTSILDPAYTPGAPATLSFARKLGQAISGTFRLLFTTAPRGDAELQGYYAVGEVTFPPAGTFRDRFELWGDVTLDCMRYVNPDDPTGSPSAPDQSSPAVDSSAAVVVNGTISSILALFTFGIAAKYALRKWRRAKERRASWDTKETRALEAMQRIREIKEKLELQEDDPFTRAEFEEISNSITMAKLDLENAIAGYPTASERGYAQRRNLRDYQKALEDAKRLEAELKEYEVEAAAEIQRQDSDHEIEMDELD